MPVRDNKLIPKPASNSRFVNLMEQFMLKWKVYRDQLNQLPVQG
jgi:hypothetical protein